MLKLVLEVEGHTIQDLVDSLGAVKTHVRDGCFEGQSFTPSASTKYMLSGVAVVNYRAKKSNGQFDTPSADLAAALKASAAGACIHGFDDAGGDLGPLFGEFRSNEQS